MLTYIPSSIGFKGNYCLFLDTKNVSQLIYCYVRVSTPIVSKYAESPRTSVSVSQYYRNTISSCREMNVSSNKANASFNQYVIARRYARFSCLTSRRGTRYYILVFYLLFSNPVLIPNLSCTCPVLVLNLYGACSVLVRSPRGGYILVNNSSVVNSILAKAKHFCFKCPRNLR